MKTRSPLLGAYLLEYPGFGRSRAFRAIVIAAVALIASCGGGDSTPDTTAAADSTTTTTTVETTTTLETTTVETAFDDDLEGMWAEVDALTNPDNWPDVLETVFRLRVAEGGTNRCPITDPADETGWVAERDPTGSILADLARVGMLDDGIFSTVDAGKLLVLRLSEAGLDVTIDEYPGGHTINNKVAELIGYLEEVVAR